MALVIFIVSMNSMCSERTKGLGGTPKTMKNSSIPIQASLCSRNLYETTFSKSGNYSQQRPTKLSKRKKSTQRVDSTVFHRNPRNNESPRTGRQSCSRNQLYELRVANPGLQDSVRLPIMTGRFSKNRIYEPARAWLLF